MVTIEILQTVIRVHHTTTRNNCSSIRIIGKCLLFFGLDAQGFFVMRTKTRQKGLQSNSAPILSLFSLYNALSAQ